MSGPAQPDLVKRFYDLWLDVSDTDAYPLFHALCMYMIGCLVEGGSIDLTLYDGRGLSTEVEMFQDLFRVLPEAPLFNLYLDDVKRTEDDIKSLRVTCKLLG